MKRYFIKVLFACLIITTFSIQKSIAQIDLSGSWTAHCVYEKPSKNAIIINVFCRHNVTGNHSEFIYEIPELVFEKGKDYFMIITSVDSIKAPYKIDEESNTLEFIFRETTYKYDILTIIKYTGDSYILRAGSCSLVYLERKEE